MSWCDCRITYSVKYRLAPSAPVDLQLDCGALCCRKYIPYQAHEMYIR